MYNDIIDVDAGTYQVLSLNVAKPSVLLPWPSDDIISAIDKKPVAAERLCLGRLNLEGDEQADTRRVPGGGQVHGGPDQAVYAYPAEHFARLAEIVGRPIVPGFVGENVTLKGGTEEGYGGGVRMTGHEAAGCRAL